jgi:hypothetical protein
MRARRTNEQRTKAEKHGTRRRQTLDTQRRRRRNESGETHSTRDRDETADTRTKMTGVGLALWTRLHRHGWEPGEHDTFSVGFLFPKHIRIVEGSKSVVRVLKFMQLDSPETI